MDILSEDDGAKGRYFTVVDGHEAEITYSRVSPALVIIDHTGVPHALRGKGVGQALAAHAVEAARAGGWKITPLCPFVRAQAMRNKDWQDVIAP